MSNEPNCTQAVWRCENIDEPRTHIYALSLGGGVVCCCGGAVHPVPVELVPCPDCYGGHFRPCNICGDTGMATRIVPNAGAEAQPQTVTPERKGDNQ